MWIKIIRFLFFALAGSTVCADQNTESINSMCNTTEVSQFVKAKYATSLNITVDNRKWAKNYFKAIKKSGDILAITGGGNILKKFKKKFKADILVVFDNDLQCRFSAKIKINGDFKDHINSTPLITSLDVKLLHGNINGVTKFKLFLPHTRKGDNEIFITSLLKELGFLSLKTYYVDSMFNNIKVRYIFQEKAGKEFIESNKLREAPILEGDERFMLVSGNWDSEEFNLARVVNKTWLKKGPVSLDIAKKSLSYLNTDYLKYGGIYLGSNALRDDNQVFSALLFALSSIHGLYGHNRKFYYDPIYQHFSSIYYDGNSDILTAFSGKLKKHPLVSYINNNEVMGAKSALVLIQNLDSTKILARLQSAGVKMSPKKLNQVISVITKKLQTLVKFSYQDKIEPYQPFFAHHDTKKVIKLAFSNEKLPKITACNFSLTYCIPETLSLKNYAKLLNGRYKNAQGIDYVFVGDKEEYQQGISKKQSDQERVKTFMLTNQSILTTYGSMEVMLDKNNKTLTLHQQNVNDRALITGGVLKNWDIHLYGTNKGISYNQQRFDKHLLTGCLTLLDTHLEEINISASNTQCEDGVNLMRAQGSIKTISIKNTMSDALDVDFSNLKFQTIHIKNAGNDCLDFSAGEYKVSFSNLKNCQDKAISVGEKSVSFFDNIDILGANTGVASKDSSIININTSNLKDVKTCFSAYNKKQEFWGGKISIKKHNCSPNQIHQQQNSLIEITKP